MNLKEIEEIEAGPQLDALVAKYVFGQSVTSKSDGKEYRVLEKDGSESLIPSYSENREAAELVVEAIRDERSGHYTLLAFTTGWKALGHTPDVRSGYPTGDLEFSRLETAPTPAVAICRAALRVFVLNDWGPTDEEVKEAYEWWDSFIGSTTEAAAKPVFLKPSGTGDQVLERTAEIIREEEEAIGIAVAYFSYKPFAEAIIDRRENGRKTFLIINGSDIIRPTGANSSDLVVPKALIQLFENAGAGLDLQIRSLGHRKKGDYQNMHHKFLVTNNIVLFGSVNWTYSALHSNYECLVVSKSDWHIRQFWTEFEDLWGSAHEVYTGRGKLRSMMCPVCESPDGVDFESYGPLCTFCGHRFEVVEST
jgi:hypothetical protein